MKRRFRFPYRSRRQIDHDVDEELRFHLVSRVEELVAGGYERDAAWEVARREFGNVEETRGWLREKDRAIDRSRRRKDMTDDLRQDLVFALRTLRKAPAFTTTAVLTLALGIGATTAIFSVVRGVLIRPLPYPDPGRLVRIWSASTEPDQGRFAVSPPDLDDWRARTESFAALGGAWWADGTSGLDLTGAGAPQRLSTAFVTAGTFDVLAVRPVVGRLPREEEMTRGGPNQVVLLSWGYWQRQFGGAPDAVGRTLQLNARPFEVIGVLPSEVAWPTKQADLFVPYVTIPDESIPYLRQVRVLGVVGRLQPGVSLEQGRAELAGIAGQLAGEYSSNRVWNSVEVEPLRATLTAGVRAALFVLFGAVTLVLLLACVNVAGLLLARAAFREPELAVRAALGGSRARLVRQLLTESVMLALLGGVVGLLVAWGGMRGLLMLGAGQLPRSGEVRIDLAVLLFSLGVTVATGILFGMAPALRSTRVEPQRTLHGGRGPVGGQRLRAGLVVAQVALAVMLAAGAGLMTRSFGRLLEQDVGFRPENLVAVQFSLSTARHDNFRLVYRAMIDRVREVPGVLAAGAVKDPPYRGNGERWGFRPEGLVLGDADERPSATVIHISDGYFHTIGARIMAGREYARSDDERAAPGLVVNEALARRWFPGESAVGRRIHLGDDALPIVGVIGDIRQTEVAEPGEPTIYMNNMANGRVKTTIVVRTLEEPGAMARRVTEAVRELDSEQTITSVFTFDDVVSQALARPRLLTVLLTAFGALGLILGAQGLYGLLAYAVAQRRDEIGVRMALGATSGDVSSLVVRRGIVLALLGIAIGAPGALWLGTLMRSVLYEVGPTDPAALATTVFAVVGAAVLASWLPARRAARVSPAVTLRNE